MLTQWASHYINEEVWQKLNEHLPGASELLALGHIGHHVHLLDGLVGLPELVRDLLDGVGGLCAVAVQHGHEVGVDRLDQFEQLAGHLQDVVGDVLLDASCGL